MSKLRDAVFGLAVAGSLGGIIYGYGTISGDWLDALRRKDVIEEVL